MSALTFVLTTLGVNLLPEQYKEFFKDIIIYDSEVKEEYDEDYSYLKTYVTRKVYLKDLYNYLRYTNLL